MELIEITADGVPARPIDALPAIAAEVMNSTAARYRTAGFRPPWVGYLALARSRCVGTCAFKTSPVRGRVEIAYFTFPGKEGRGVATSMAESLIELASKEDPVVRICAQTLPERNASTRVLEKLGFKHIAELEHTEDGVVWEWELVGKAQQDQRSVRSKPRH